jgi:molybdopterin synthase sulfur carrier subunit
VGKVGIGSAKPSQLSLGIIMVVINYFASIRENLGVAQEQLTLAAAMTVRELIAVLVNQHGALWQRHLQDSKTLVAVNQEVATLSTIVSDGDEVAFFPPVTGG